VVPAATGLSASHEGEYRFLLSALTHDPDFHPVARRAGAALADKDDTDRGLRAIDAQDALLRVRPDDYLSWTLQGMLHGARGQDEAAISALRGLSEMSAPPPKTSKDRDLISRMFGTQFEFDNDDATSPGADFLDRLDDEATAWNPDNTVWDED
jgi:hypothetical protein